MFDFLGSTVPAVPVKILHIGIPEISSTNWVNPIGNDLFVEKMLAFYKITVLGVPDL